MGRGGISIPEVFNTCMCCLGMWIVVAVLGEQLESMMLIFSNLTHSLTRGGMGEVQCVLPSVQAAVGGQEVSRALSCPSGDAGGCPVPIQWWWHRVPAVPGRDPAPLYPHTALAISHTILPSTSRVFKSLLDVGLGCCHNISNQIRELMWAGMTRHRSLWSYFSSSSEWERVKKAAWESPFAETRELKVYWFQLAPAPHIFEHRELCFSLALQKWLFDINTDSFQCLQVSWYSKSPCHRLLEYRGGLKLPTLSIHEWIASGKKIFVPKWLVFFLMKKGTIQTFVAVSFQSLEWVTGIQF